MYSFIFGLYSLGIYYDIRLDIILLTRNFIYSKFKHLFLKIDKIFNGVFFYTKSLTEIEFYLIVFQRRFVLLCP